MIQAWLPEYKGGPFFWGGATSRKRLSRGPLQLDGVALRIFNVD